MISNIEIKVNEDSFEISKHNALTGEVCFSVNNQYFPELYWNDFPLIILTWWSKSISNNSKLGIGVLYKFNFMDGPFCVHGVKSEGELINLKFLENRKREIIILEAICSVKQFENELLLASKKIIKKVERMKWNPKDYVEFINTVSLMEFRK